MTDISGSGFLEGAATRETTYSFQRPKTQLPVSMLPEEQRRIGLPSLCLIAFAVGIVTGLGAIVFRDLVGLVHNVLFLGDFSMHYEAERFTPPAPWGPFVILVPVIGGLAVTFLVSNFAPEAKGHGVPEVMYAIFYKGGVIRPIVVVIKSLASAISIGSGAAVGREGPIIQIGSALGSFAGQVMKITSAERTVLVACGAGAGIAATFNTPIGGVMFAIELLLPETSMRTFLPVALSTGTATFIGRYFFGPQPAFDVPNLLPLDANAATALSLLSFALLGAVTGAAAAGFIRGLHFAEDAFERIEGRYLRHFLGMLSIGIMIYALQQGFGEYYVEGVGYATIQAILFSHITSAGLLFLLFFCKLAATSISIGSGSSGGVFSPSLFMGATIGGAFAGLLQILPLPFEVHAPSFAIVGMGAMVGGSTGAVMTSITMIFEMTRDYGIVLPLIVAVGLSVGVRTLFSKDSIYTGKLSRRGVSVPEARHANLFLVKKAGEVMDRDFVVAPASMSFTAFCRLPEHRGRLRHVVIHERNKIMGVLRINTGFREVPESCQGEITLGDLSSKSFTVVRSEDPVLRVINRIRQKGAFMALVVNGRGVPRPGDVAGVIDKEHVANSVADTVSSYPM